MSGRGGKGGGGGGGFDPSGLINQILQVQEKAAKEAVELKEKATLQGLESVQDNYQLAFGDLGPFQGSSYESLDELQDMLGIARPVVGSRKVHDWMAENIDIRKRNELAQEQYQKELDAWNNRSGVTSRYVSNMFEEAEGTGPYRGRSVGYKPTEGFLQSLGDAASGYDAGTFDPIKILNEAIGSQAVSGQSMGSGGAASGIYGVAPDPRLDSPLKDMAAAQQLENQLYAKASQWMSVPINVDYNTHVRGSILNQALQGGYRVPVEPGPKPEAPDLEDLHDLSDLEYDKLTSEEIFEKLYNRPGVSSRLNMGLRAMDRTAAAKGQLFSGTHAVDVTDFAQELAATEYDKEINRLMAMTFGTGEFTKQQSGTQVGLGQDIGSLYDSLGTTQANARVSSASSAIGAIGALGAASAAQSGGGGGGGGGILGSLAGGFGSAAGRWAFGGK